MKKKKIMTIFNPYSPQKISSVAKRQKFPLNEIIPLISNAPKISYKNKFPPIYFFNLFVKKEEGQNQSAARAAQLITKS